MTAEAPPSFWQRLGDARLRDVVRFRLQPRVNWKQLVASTDLPANVRGVIEQVVRRTRLWKREKADVSRELIAHFQDGIAAGVSADELVAEFGDVAQSAKLIRRAKRRGRSIIWHAWHLTCMTIAAVLVLYVLTSIYQWTGRPKIKVDYLAKINAPALSAPADDRAWPLYRKALNQVLVDHDFPDWLWDCAWNPNLPPGDPKWKQATKWLDDHEAALSLIRQASKKPAFGLAISMSPEAYAAEDRDVLFKPGARDREVSTGGTGLADETLLDRLLTPDLPHRDRLLHLAELLTIDARRTAREGKGDTTLADVEAIFGIANHFQQIPLLGQACTADAVQADACSLIRDLQNEHPDLWSDDQIRDLAHTISAARIDWTRALEGDRLRFLDNLQRMYTDNGRGNGRLAFRGPTGLNLLQRIGFISIESTHEEEVPHDGLAAAFLPVVNFVLPSRQQLVALYDHFAAGMLEQVSDPVWHLELPLDKERDELGAGPLGSFRSWFTVNMLPYYPRFRGDLALMRGARDGVLVGLALELYHREHKAWPKSLNELSPRWLPAVPIDRMTGGPLKYKIVDDCPLVYSVGIDGNDDDAGRLSVSPSNLYPDSAGPYLQDPGYDGDWVLWGPRIKPPAEASAEDAAAPGSADNPFG